MLTHLSIRDLAIIPNLSIDMTRGFNVITGETGAGKSILLMALQLLQGCKASPEMIRSGADESVVIGQFVVPARHGALDKLRALGLADDDQVDALDVLVRRQISTRGRSQAWINDTPVTLATLRDVCEMLLDMSGQHDNRELLSAASHVRFVDRFVTDAALPDAFRRKFNALAARARELEDFVRDLASRQRDRDYLAFRHEELNKFNPSQGDWASTHALCQKAKFAATYSAALGKATSLIDEGASGQSLARALRDVSRALSGLPKGLNGDNDFSPIAEEADLLAERVDDLSYRLGRLSSGYEADDADLESSERRIAGYQDLFRKMGVADVDALVAEWERLGRDLSALDNAANELRMRLLGLQAEARELTSMGAKLTRARQAASKTVKQLVEDELKYLGMQDARLEVQSLPVDRAIPAINFSAVGSGLQDLWVPVAEALSSHADSGAERLVFQLAANPGEPAQALNKVASGGELSRILLALKCALANELDAPTLVFDEIDTGVSGRIADRVGNKLKALSNKTQVIVVSHLAQVAAYADSHLVVAKHSVKGRTEVRIARLTRDESAAELARLLSGIEVTDPSLANARNLMERARGASAT